MLRKVHTHILHLSLTQGETTHIAAGIIHIVVKVRAASVCIVIVAVVIKREEGILAAVGGNNVATTAIPPHQIQIRVAVLTRCSSHRRISPRAAIVVAVVHGVSIEYSTLVEPIVRDD